MNKEKRTPMDLMDDIYSLAYWMTGSETSANELVNVTYLNVDNQTHEREVFKTFRECYFDSLEEDISSSVSESPYKPNECKGMSLRQRFADIKLSVLLSEIPGLRHSDISNIIGKPLDTIRLWLSSGRQSFAEGLLSFDSPLLHGVSIKKGGVLCKNFELPR